MKGIGKITKQMGSANTSTTTEQNIKANELMISNKDTDRKPGLTELNMKEPT